MLPKLTKQRILAMVEDGLSRETKWKALKLSEHQPAFGSTVITYEHRSDILEWLLAVSTQHRFYPETYSLAVAVLHRFLVVVKAQPKYLKCLALTCLNIAAKINEEDEVVPHIADFVRHSSASCTVADVVRMEMIVLNKLSWDVNLVTSLHFLQACHAYLLLETPDLITTTGLTPGQHVSSLTYRLNFLLTSYEACHYRPSLLAVSLLSLELENIRSDWFALTLQLLKLIHVNDFSQLISCRENMALQLADSYTPQTSHYTKSHKRAAPVQDLPAGKRKFDDRPEPEEFFDSFKKLYNEELMDVGTQPIDMAPED